VVLTNNHLPCLEVPVSHSAQCCNCQLVELANSSIIFRCKQSYKRLEWTNGYFNDSL